MTKNEYINGCYTRYGSRPLNTLEVKASKVLSNGMFAVVGNIPEDGVSVDVYNNKSKSELIFMEHGITILHGNLSDTKMLNMIYKLIENRCFEMGI